MSMTGRFAPEAALRSREIQLPQLGKSEKCRYCCKSRFAEGIKISEGRWLGFRVEM